MLGNNLDRKGASEAEKMSRRGTEAEGCYDWPRSRSHCHPCVSWPASTGSSYIHNDHEQSTSANPTTHLPEVTSRDSSRALGKKSYWGGTIKYNKKSLPDDPSSLFSSMTRGKVFGSSSCVQKAGDI